MKNIKNITHVIHHRSSGEKIYLYDAKHHKVYKLNGEYHSQMGNRFTEMCLEGNSTVYYFKKANLTLENK